jgi:hypothetical protein
MKKSAEGLKDEPIIDPLKVAINEIEQFDFME